MTKQDHYAPLDPSESPAPVDARDTVFLGPFCDEEHAREILVPVVAKAGARVAGPDDEELHRELCRGYTLTTSEGMWVGLEAQFCPLDDREYTDYGFVVVPQQDPEDPYGPPARYRIHPIEPRANGTFMRTAAIAEYPGGDYGDPTSGADEELCARGNTDDVERGEWILEDLTELA